MINNILPSGDNLKTLLSQNKISKSDIKSVLRQRGVFVSNDDKSNTVPLLIKSLITPLEFNELQEKIKTKEHSSKVNMRTLEWSSKDTLIDAIGDDLNLDELIDDPFCNYSVENISGFYVKDDNEDSIALDFSIKRIDLMNSWDEVEQYFSGRIELEKKQSSEKIEVNISLNHTSNETKLVAEKILKNLNIHLKSQGHIKQDSEMLKIQFNHFNNSGRIAFLEDIAKSHFQNEFYYQKIIDVDFYPDSSNSFPDDLKWLEKNIDELKLKGTLSESIFFTNKKLHPNLKISKLVASYTMEDIGYNAECKISYEFPEFSSRKVETAELVIDFKSFNGKGSSNSKINKIKASIMKILESKKISIYEKHKENIK